MRFWHLLHIAGFTLWLGGGLAGMYLGIRGRREDRATQGLIVRLLAGIHRSVMFPGIILTLASGIPLSIPAARATAPSAWLMVMQGLGVIAAILVLFVSLPTLARLERVSPTGDTAPAFDALRKRQAMAGMFGGLLGAIALVAGVLHRY
jgi:hypothetical protein